MPGVVYIHGFNSSPASHKAMQLRARMRALGVEEDLSVPALPTAPQHAIAQLESLIAALGPRDLTLIGSSLGGYYATWLAEKYGLKAVLINPAVSPYRLLLDYLGENENPYTGERYVIGEADVEVLKVLEVGQLSRPEDFLVLLESGDEVLDYREAVAKYANCRVRVYPGGGHEFLNFETVLDDILVYCGYSRLSQPDQT